MFPGLPQPCRGRRRLGCALGGGPDRQRRPKEQVFHRGNRDQLIKADVRHAHLRRWSAAGSDSARSRGCGPACLTSSQVNPRLRLLRPHWRSRSFVPVKAADLQTSGVEDKGELRCLGSKAGLGCGCASPTRSCRVAPGWARRSRELASPDAPAEQPDRMREAGIELFLKEFSSVREREFYPGLCSFIYVFISSTNICTLLGLEDSVGTRQAKSLSA